MRSKFKDEHPFGLWYTPFHAPQSAYCVHREAQGRGRAHPAEVPRSYSRQFIWASLLAMLKLTLWHISIGYLWEGGPDRHPHHRQEEVPSTFSTFMTTTRVPSLHNSWFYVVRTWRWDSLFMSFGNGSNWHPRKRYSYLSMKFFHPQQHSWVRSTKSTSSYNLSVLDDRILLTVLLRDEDNFLYVSYSGENTFGQEGWVELP